MQLVSACSPDPVFWFPFSLFIPFHRTCLSHRFPHSPVNSFHILWECTGIRLHLMRLKSHFVCSSLRSRLYMPLPHSGLLILVCVLPAVQMGGGMVFPPHSKRLPLFIPDSQDFTIYVMNIPAGQPEVLTPCFLVA